MTKPRKPSDEDVDEETHIFAADQLAVTTANDNPESTVIAPPIVSKTPTPVPVRGKPPSVGPANVPRASGLGAAARPAGDSKPALNTIPRPAGDTPAPPTSGLAPRTRPAGDSKPAINTVARPRDSRPAINTVPRTKPPTGAPPSSAPNETTAPDTRSPFARGEPPPVTRRPETDAVARVARGDALPARAGAPIRGRSALLEAATIIDTERPVQHRDAGGATSAPRTRNAPDTTRGRPEPARAVEPRGKTPSSAPLPSVLRSKPVTNAPSLGPGGLAVPPTGLAPPPRTPEPDLDAGASDELPDATNPAMRTILDPPDPTNPAITMPRMPAFEDGAMTPKPTVVRQPRAPSELGPEVTNPLARRYQATPGPEMTLTNAIGRMPDVEATGPESEVTDPDPPIVAPDATKIGMVDYVLAPRTLPVPAMPPAGPLDAPGERMIPARLQRYTPTSMQAAAPPAEPQRKVADHLRMYTPTSMLTQAPEVDPGRLPNPMKMVALDAPVFDPPSNNRDPGNHSDQIKVISMKGEELAGPKREAKAPKAQLRSIHDVSGPIGPPPAGFGYLAPPRQAARPSAPRGSRGLVWMILATLAIAIAVATTMYLVMG